MSDESLSSQTETSGAEMAESLLTEAATADAESQGTETTEEKPVEGAPEAYEFKLPEGANGGELLSEFSDIAKGMNLPQDKAQELVDLWQRSQQQQLEQWKAVKDGWAEEVKADKEVGGAKFNQTMENCGRFLKEMDAPPEFLKLLDDYGIGNHPAFVKMINRVALKTLEDKPVITNAGVGTADVDTRIRGMYSNSNMQ